MARILIVDDEKHIRLLYSEELKEEGYEVFVAADGNDILDRIEKDRPDVIILDIKWFHRTASMSCRRSGTGIITSPSSSAVHTEATR